MQKIIIKKTAIILSIFICFSLFTIGVVFMQKDKITINKKVLIIGIDGFDPKIVSTLLAKGMLPNIQKIIEKGSFINLSTSNPPQSPVAWMTIATGVNPGKHGIFDFMEEENHNIKLSLTKQKDSFSQNSYEQPTDALKFWDYTSNINVPTNIIRWPITFPPEKINGVMLSGLGVPDIKGFLSGYTLYTTKDITSDKDSNIIIKITPINNIISTKIFGPKINKENSLVTLTSDMNIEIKKDYATIITNEGRYDVKKDEWSDWISITFKINMFQSVSAISKVYFSSLKPFELYMTAIQINPKKFLTDISYPNDYSKQLANDIGLYYTLGMPEETGGYLDNVLSKDALLAQIKDIENERYKMFWNEFKNFKKKGGVYAFVFDSSDRVQHVFWDKNIINNISLDNPIIKYYVDKDVFIGELLSKIDNDTTLLILSDHGFASFDKSVNINNWLVENRFMKLTKDITDAAPLFQDVNWGNTQVYSVGFNSLYLNLNEENFVNKEEIIKKLISSLENWKDEGVNVVTKVYRKEDIYSGEYLEKAPDLIIGFNEGYRMSSESAIGGFSKKIIESNTKEWSGDHMFDPSFVPGVLISTIKFNKNNANQVDIVPTILEILKIKKPKTLDGISLI